MQPHEFQSKIVNRNYNDFSPITVLSRQMPWECYHIIHGLRK